MIRKLINYFIPVSKGVEGIGQQMIDSPMEWKQGDYEFINIKHPDIRIWTCNGISYITIGGFKGLSISDKIYLANCIKISIAKRLNHTLLEKHQNKIK